MREHNLMSHVKCLYCGKQMSDSLANCPECGAVSHFQKRGFRNSTRRNFLFFFVALALTALCLALWLPR